MSIIINEQEYVHRIRSKVKGHSKPIPEKWHQPVNRYGWFLVFRVLVPFFGSLGLTPYLWEHLGFWGLAIVAPLIGIYAYKISFIMHDCCHSSLFRSRKLNFWVGTVCGYFVGADFKSYAETHKRHHRYNGLEMDPQAFEVTGFKGNKQREILWHLFSPLFGLRSIDYLRFYFSPPQKKEVQKIAPHTRSSRIWLLGVLAAQILITTILTQFGQYPWLFLIFPICTMTISLSLSRMRTFA